MVVKDIVEVAEAVEDSVVAMTVAEKEDLLENALTAMKMDILREIAQSLINAKKVSGAEVAEEVEEVEVSAIMEAIVPL